MQYYFSQALLTFLTEFRVTTVVKWGEGVSQLYFLLIWNMFYKQHYVLLFCFKYRNNPIKVHLRSWNGNYWIYYFLSVHVCILTASGFFRQTNIWLWFTEKDIVNPIIIIWLKISRDESSCLFWSFGVSQASALWIANFFEGIYISDCMKLLLYPSRTPFC